MGVEPFSYSLSYETGASTGDIAWGDYPSTPMTITETAYGDLVFMFVGPNGTKIISTAALGGTASLSGHHWERDERKITWAQGDCYVGPL